MRKIIISLFFIGIILAVVFSSCQQKATPSSPSEGPTNTPENATYTNTPVYSYTITPTQTNTYTQAATGTNTPYLTFTRSHTPFVSRTGTFTRTETPENTGSVTPTRTVLIESATVTITKTAGSTASFTRSLTITETIEIVYTATSTITPGSSFTCTPIPEDTFTATPTITATPAIDRGSAIVTPTEVYAKTGGNEIIFTYTAGSIGWAGGAENGVLRIKMPAGWSQPSLDPASAGYFSVSVTNGALLGKSVEGMDIVVSVRGLAAGSGQITVVYGDRDYGPGAYVDGSGTIIIPVEVDENSSDGISTTEIESSPEIYVVPATPTPVVGEGTMSLTTSVVTDGSSGNTLEFTYTAGETTWAASPDYGTLKVSLPSGWSVPSVESSDPGYFYVTSTAAGLWIGTVADGQDMIVNISDLEPYESIKIYYGYKGFGGGGAEINGQGIFTLTTMTDTDGNDLYEIADSPEIEVIPPTPTITVTFTISPTFSYTPTITMTSTITRTHTITKTRTITKTHTITPTVTQTYTNTVTPTRTMTPTYTATPTPFWDVVGVKGFSAGGAEYISLFVDSGKPFVGFVDEANTNRATVMEYNGSSWQVTGGTSGFSEGIAYETSLFVDNAVPYLVFRDYDYGNKVSLMRHNSSSGDWEYIGERGLSEGPGYGPSLYIYSGEPFVAYRDTSNSAKASVRKYRFLVDWEYTGSAGISDSTASSISLFVDGATGVPYIAYRDWEASYKTTVMKYEGGSWSAVGQKGFSDGGAEYLSLFIYNSTLYLAYMDVANSNKATVKYFDGSAWQTLGTEGFSAGSAEYISLFVCAGEASIAFRDEGNSSRAVIMKYEGGGWALKAVLSDAGAKYTGLFFDTSVNKPYAAFRDENRGGKITVMTYEGAY